MHKSHTEDKRSQNISKRMNKSIAGQFNLKKAIVRS